MQKFTFVIGTYENGSLQCIETFRAINPEAATDLARTCFLMLDPSEVLKFDFKILRSDYTAKKGERDWSSIRYKQIVGV